jgi:hypothetical protein
MIKDILVNLSYGTSQDGVSNYALSVAETFGAHVVGTAFYPAIVGGVDLPANFIRAQQAEAREHAESVATAFDEATRRAGVSAETRRIEAGIGDVPTQFAHIADASIFPSLANLKGTGIIERISLLRRRCSTPEDRCSSFLLFRRIASNSIMSWCAGMAAGQPRERSPMPCRFLPAPARRVLLFPTLRAPKAKTFRGRISRPICPVTE